MFIVDLGFEVKIRFKEEEDARNFCDKYLEKTGDVLSIREKRGRK